MPPKVTNTYTAQNEALHKVEERTTAGTWQIVVTFAEDLYDAVTLMCVFGVEREGLSSKKIYEEYEKGNTPKTAKRIRESTKRAVKKPTKRSARRFTRKAVKKVVERVAERTAKKAAKKITKKAANQRGHIAWV